MRYTPRVASLVMTTVDFPASEYQADGGFRPARYRFEGSPDEGWAIQREGRPHLRLGPGYRLLRTHSCGVCSTDLARRFLPFPLPQITGHELVALDDEGARYAVEINASHLARGMRNDCPFCASGLANHCPERIVLGIHDLPGGFGPWVLVPIRAALRIPDEIPTESAVLIEPLAAALNAVTTVAPRDGERIAVLGPRRLGMLVVAALAAWRRKHGASFEILALSRRERLLALARALGADETRLVDESAGGAGGPLEPRLADVVIDTTGDPRGLELALRLARREVHLKSTHGRGACGLEHTTELVVDELALAPLPSAVPDRGSAAARDLGLDGTARPRVAWMADLQPPGWLSERSEVLRGSDAAAALDAIEAGAAGRLPRAEAAVALEPAQVDAAIRPRARASGALIRPRGTILLHPSAARSGSALLAAVAGGLRLSSSRCGDFHAAIELMAGDAHLRGVGERLVTHRFSCAAVPQAFETARSSDCIKAVVEHGEER